MRSARNLHVSPDSLAAVAVPLAYWPFGASRRCVQAVLHYRQALPQSVFPARHGPAARQLHPIGHAKMRRLQPRHRESRGPKFVSRSLLYPPLVTRHLGTRRCFARRGGALKRTPTVLHSFTLYCTTCYNEARTYHYFLGQIIWMYGSP